MLNLSNDYALMQNAGGEYLIGLGPFLEVEKCPSKGVAFYVNDFALSSNKPWKIPTKIERLDKLPLVEAGIEVEWQELPLSPFDLIFNEVSQSICRGDIKKSVPCVTEMGKVIQGELRELIFKKQRNPLLHPYAWVQGNSGFCGLSPEVLFSHHRGIINTMALAGTANKKEQNVFSVDEKEICEHEFVAQTLISKLNEIGMVKPSTRKIMELESLVHFHTPIEVHLYGASSLEELIQRLHPTPALGPLPRTEESMKDLLRWRELVGCPESFGAPMGVYDNGKFHSVVCIRGVQWQGTDVTLPAGCGVIEASRLVNEWRELGLKRNSVKRLFSL